MTAHPDPGVAVRQATPDDAAIRFYRRLGATVRAKVMRAWPAAPQPIL